MTLNKAIERMNKVENMILHGNDSVAILTQARMAVGDLLTRKQYKAQARAARLETFKDCRAFQRSIKPQAQAARSLVLAMREQVAKDCAPALQAAREIDLFINSGKSLVGWLKERATSPTLPAWARLQAPPLPVGLPMPPNICRNPVKL